MSGWDIDFLLNGLPWKWTEMILFLRLHPSTAFWTLVDYEGYSISSKGFLPTVVDIMVIWMKIHPFLSILVHSFLKCRCSLCHLWFCVQVLSCVWLFATPWDCSMPGFPFLHYLLGLAQTHVHQVGDAIQMSCPLLLPSIFPSIKSPRESALHIRWPKYWSFSLSVSPSNEHSGLISFRID